MSVAKHPGGRQFPPDPVPRILLGGSVNLFAGAPGSGKTALLAWLLADLRDGKPLFGHPTNRPPKIAILSIDRSWSQSSKLWFDLAGFTDVPHYSLQDDDDFDIDRLEHKRLRMQILRDALDKLLPLPFGSIVIVDPIAPFLGGNLMDYDACMVACSRIRRAARERGITILGVSHAGKQKNDSKDRYTRLQDRIVGSCAQFGYTDTQMYLCSPEESGEKFYSFLWHPHHAPPELFQLGRRADGTFVPWEQSVVAQEESALLQAIPSTPEGIGFGELIVAAGASKSTIHRALQLWTKDGTIEKVGHGRYRKPASH